MKSILRLLLVFLIVTMPLVGEELPHLILYFDINKTLIASDKVGHKSVEDVLNELLAEKYKARWEESLPKEMTFEAYVKECLVPGSKENPDLKKKRRSYLHHFVDYLLENHHPLYPTVLNEYEATLAHLKASQTIVFTSFYALLDDLDRKGVSYSVVLRSFGEEVFDVKNEIGAVRGGMFSQTGKFREGRLLLGESKFEGSYDIYHQLRRIDHAAIHDDWNYWNEHGMAAKQGKPFYIDRTDTETLSIFFDDNICDNIIAPIDVATGELIPIEELIGSGQAVRVDTLKAIVDTDYFKDRVQAALTQ